MTRKIASIALSIGLLIVCVYFLIDTVSQNQEQAALKTQITDVITTIDQIPQPPRDVEQRIADIQAELETEQERLSSEIDTTGIIDTFRELAATNNITLTWLSTTPWSSVNIDGYEYLILKISLDLEGSLNDLEIFVGEIEDRSSGEVHVQYLDVSNNDEDITSPAPVSISLDVAIYAHPPITD